MANQNVSYETGNNDNSKDNKCSSCFKVKKMIGAPTVSAVAAVNRSSTCTEKEKEPAESAKLTKSSPFSFKLHNFKQIFEGSKDGYNQCCSSSSTDGIDKKSLAQKIHSLSLLKSKDWLNQNDALERCSCDDITDGWYHTWPERGKDKLKSPKKSAANVDKECDSPDERVSVDELLKQLPIAYDPVSRKLKLVQPKDSTIDEEPLTAGGQSETMGHKRQPSALSNISSSTGSEAHFPLMTNMNMQSNPQSYSSLSSLSNYSSSTDQTNSLERSCQPPRFGLASFWQRTFARKSADEQQQQQHQHPLPSWKLFSRTPSFFQRSLSGQSSRSSLASDCSPTSTLRNVGSSGLILESRPAFLPAKCPEEELHHQLLHQKLFEETQKREKNKLLVNLFH